jgi:enoyl-[acyl-carrier protein] reductase II
MYPEVLREHIQKCKKRNSSFGVNVPTLYPNIEEIMKIIVEEEGVKIVLLPAGIQKT